MESANTFFGIEGKQCVNSVCGILMKGMSERNCEEMMTDS
jgi:hypothetical protein